MSGNYLSNAGIFLVDFIFGLYILAVVLRFLLQDYSENIQPENKVKERSDA